jgi:hypothetical protein
MKWSLSCILFLSAFPVAAQQLEGTVFDKDSRQALDNVTLIDKRTGRNVISDAKGKFIVTAFAGDTILLYRPSYKPVLLIMPYSSGTVYRSVFMEQLSYKLGEAVINGNTAYQQDSLAMRNTFQHSLDRNIPIKPEFEFAGGIAVRGLFSTLAEHLLGQTKKKKKFRNTFFEDEKNKFIATRYSPELVTALTGLTGDSVGYFMNARPMPYDYARSASDLELKMWIRYNYRQWMNKLKDSTLQRG